MFLYTLYDNVLDEHLPVFQSKNDQAAKRDYEMMMRRNDVSRNDFNLVRHFEINLDGDNHKQMRFRPCFEVINTEVKDG
jgi:hypothetical protein